MSLVFVRRYFFFALPARRHLAPTDLAVAPSAWLHTSRLQFFGAVAGFPPGVQPKTSFYEEVRR